APDVEEVQLELVASGDVAVGVDLGHPGETGAHLVALGVAGDPLHRDQLAPPASISAGARARGPTKLMSPTKMFQSWGSPPTADARSQRPTRATRGSVSPDRIWRTPNIFRRPFFGKFASPTARTSSTRRISGPRCAATAKASLTYMP